MTAKEANRLANSFSAHENYINTEWGYIELQVKRAASVGGLSIDYDLPHNVNRNALLQKLQGLGYEVVDSPSEVVTIRWEKA